MEFLMIANKIFLKEIKSAVSNLNENNLEEENQDKSLI
jgi:hypothetical protein